jgi:hypothetical protein
MQRLLKMIYAFKKIAIGLSILLLITGCKNFHANTRLGNPAGHAMEVNYGPELFRKGYKDGCSSGYSGYGDNFHKFFHAWAQDPNLVTEPMYYQVWKDAYAYCAFASMMHPEMGLGNWR